MKWWGLIIFVLFLVFIMGSLLWGVYSLVSKVFASVRQSMPLSPLEGDIRIENTNECSDTDGGIFFLEKGKITYKMWFLFLKWRVDISDECKGDELIEYYCGGENSFTKGVVSCEKGCVEGKCV